jgi:hypothetical protein
MTFTNTQASQVNTVVRHLAGGGATREQAVEALVELIRAASLKLLAGYTPERALKDLTAHWPDTSARTWTAENGTTYDLTVPYRDDIGDPWAFSGWLVRADGTAVPYVECRGLSTELPVVIRDFGPIAPDIAPAADPARTGTTEK